MSGGHADGLECVFDSLKKALLVGRNQKVYHEVIQSRFTPESKHFDSFDAIEAVNKAVHRAAGAKRLKVLCEDLGSVEVTTDADRVM